MFRAPVRWLFLTMYFAGMGIAFAHRGYENETDVRIFADRMEINVHATLGFAWKILGDRAPADTGEAGRQIAIPLLKEVAQGLYQVSSGGIEMVSRSANSSIEVDDHVFFLLVYDRPPAWPLVLKATFFDNFDPLTYGTVKVFDQTADPYRRDIDPVADGKIYRSHSTFTYDPAPPAEVGDEATVTPIPPPEKPGTQGSYGYLLAALLIVLIWLIRQAVSKEAVK